MIPAGFAAGCVSEERMNLADFMENQLNDAIHQLK